MNYWKILAFWLVTLLIVGGVGVNFSSTASEEEIEGRVTSFAGGSGTESSPYLISNVTQLQNMNQNLGGHYKLINDINASKTKDWNDGRGFVPVGNDNEGFTGSLDGQGYDIDGLWINRSRYHCIGLFGEMNESASVKDVSIVDADVSGGGYVGGLVGVNRGTVMNSYATGNVSGAGQVGGLVGFNSDVEWASGMVSDSYATGDVSGYENVGALVGGNHGTVNNSYATGNVSGRDDNVGGLVGYNGGTVSNSYATGNVSGYSKVGGLVGKNKDGTVSNSYAIGDLIWGYWYLGGLVGENTGTVNNSYAAGKVVGNEFVGGLVGENDGTVNNSYATGNVSGWRKVGGLVGSNYPGIVSNSFATSKVAGDRLVGGLVGSNYRGIVSNSFATGNVSGSDDDVGGLVGYNFNGRINNSYATGNVSGNESVGGLIGHNKGTLSNSYATGNIRGENYTGGLVGENEGNVSNSFWDMNTTGQSSSTGGTGKTTGEMKDIGTFTNLSTEGLDEPWDFVGDPNDDNGKEDIWDIDEDEEINDGYPFLSWEGPYQLTVNIEGQGTVKANNEEIKDGETLVYKMGTEVEIEAVAGEGMVFERWVGDNETVTDPEANLTSMTIQGNHSITAKFTAIYDLTIDSTTDGNVTLPGEGSFTYEAGEEVELEAVADLNHHFVRWTGDNGTIADPESNRTSITMEDNHSITAKFAVDTYELTIDSTEGGNVTLAGEGSFTYDAGEEVEIEAVADPDYHFVKWAGDNGTIADPESNRTSITMEDNHSITAKFAVDTYDLTIDSTSGGNVTQPGEGSFTYEWGESIELEASSKQNYHFIEWIGDNGTIADPESNLTTITVEDNHSITAKFAVDTYELTIDSTKGGNVTLPGEGSFTYEAGEEVELEAVADPDYHFIKWTGDNETIADPEANLTTITMEDNHSITARFAVDTYELIIDSTEGGNVTLPGEGTFTYESGEEVEIEAVADTDYHFSGWTGDDGSERNTITITMDSDKNITAHFEPIPVEYYHLTVNVEGNGTVIVKGEEVEDGWIQEYEEGTEVTLNATADEGWIFDGWTGTTESGQEITVNVTEDMDITATFAEEEDVDGDEDDEDDEDEIPVFTFALLIILAAILVIWAMRRKKKKELPVLEKAESLEEDE
ncbi:MAG: hypothetical protein KGY76_07565 [Candidatus Thermoplasmatota archaeon]|nr:hypothetical protein [Candidatus Thermoplasmatota archaeon]